MNRAVFLILALVSATGAAALAGQAQAPLTVAYMTNGELVPLARYDGTRWRNTWSEALQADAPLPVRTVGEIPRAWLGRPVPLTSTAWSNANGKHERVTVTSIDRAAGRGLGNPCGRERDDAMTATGDANGADVQSLRRRITRAFALFRFHRGNEALVQLDRAARRVENRPDLFRPYGPRIRQALDGLRSCLSSSAAPGLATLTVRTFRFDGGTMDALGARTGAGVYVRVDDIFIGRTVAGGVLRAQVPSGSIEVTTIVPSTALGAAEVTLEPGGSRDISVGLVTDKEVVAETDLALVEGDDGVFHATASSLTLRFTADDQPVPLRREMQVELLDPAGGVKQDLSRLFTITNGDVVAIDLQRVSAALRSDNGRPVRLRVYGLDAAGFTHANTVEFRVEQR